MSTPSSDLAHPTARDLQDIQGNLIGFNKDHQRLMFVTIPTLEAGRGFLSSMTAEVNHGAEVKDFNAEYKARALAREDQLAEQASWVNVAFSFPGLQQLGADGVDAFPDDFKQGMRARAADNGDVDTSDPSNWASPFATNEAPVHALVIIAADSPELLDQRTAAVRALITQAGVSECGAPQDGNARPGDQRGHEHFGFKDGISQPSILGLTTSSKGGADIAAGEFLIGWPDQDGNISGQPQPGQPTSPNDPGYPNPAPSPQPQPMPPWTKNGSFLVYRRLRQDVVSFHDFSQTNAASVQMSPEQLEAKLVGRWPDGAPLERVPGEPHDLDPSTADPAPTDPNVLHDDHINNFKYAEHDADGHAVPKAAHIRKSYPRDQQPPGGLEANRHRILRRGIPYGPEVQPTETPYGTEPVPDERDRGLLFIGYQSSITGGFEFIQRSWANKSDFPDPGSGQDPIISQSAAPAFPLPVNPQFATQRWVTTTGGDYFFAPSISAIGLLGGSSAT
jgi:Dyp-type peroxidase family